MDDSVSLKRRSGAGWREDSFGERGDGLSSETKTVDERKGVDKELETVQNNDTGRVCDERRDVWVTRNVNRDDLSGVGFEPSAERSSIPSRNVFPEQLGSHTLLDTNLFRHWAGQAEESEGLLVFDDVLSGSEGEPSTPRPTERLHSPCWVPPPQEPPFFLKLPPTATASTRRRAYLSKSNGRNTEGASRSRGVDEGTGTHGVAATSPLRPSMTNIEHASTISTHRLQRRCTTAIADLPISAPRVSKSLTLEPSNRKIVRNGDRAVINGVSGSARVPTCGDPDRRSSVALSPRPQCTATPACVPEEVRHKMTRVQETRDRYLR